MAPKVVLQLFPVVGGRLAKTYRADNMDELDHIPLVLLGNESAASAEKQIRRAFSRCSAAKNGGAMDLTVNVAGVAKPSQKELCSILEWARTDDPDLLDLDVIERTLKVYIDFQAVERRKGRDQRLHRTAMLQGGKPARHCSTQPFATSCRICRGKAIHIVQSPAKAVLIRLGEPWHLW